MPQLLAISIGPVQEFIAAGRKTRDLWFGSRLLSDIARAAATALGTRARLIFPATVDAESAIGNKLLAEVEDGSDPADLVASVRQAARAELRRHRDAAWERAAGQRDLINEDLLDDQLSDFLEIYAAWTPLNGDYPAARARVDRLLAGRKALRDFGPARGYPLPKSSLDPSRESVVRVVRADDAASIARLARLRIKRGELLDGVSLVKRLAADERFVSVVRLAIDPFIRRVVAERGSAGLEPLREMARALEQSDAVERFSVKVGSGREQFAAFPFDTLLFWNDGSNDEGLTDNERRTAKAFHAEARQLYRTLQISEPPAYYAVLLADGDRMGSALAGMTSVSAHRAFSAALAGFATRAGQVVSAHQGALVYSGGDDVLAFLPVDRCLACADALRRQFLASMQPVSGNAPISLSVGVAIAHIYEPLHAVLGWARAAEGHAKEVRNALAVALHTRSGGAAALRVRYPWASDPVGTHWDRWTDWHYHDRFPDGAAYELRALERELRDLGRHDPRASSALLEREMRRILKRKRSERGQRALGDDEIDSMVAAASGNGAEPLDALRTLVDALVLARRLADVRRIAEGPAHAR